MISKEQRSRWPVVALSLSAAALLGFSACGGTHRERKPARAVAVRTVEAARSPLPASEAFVGNIESRSAVTLSTKMMGRILRIPVEVGDTVKRGQLLVEVDAAEAKSARAQAQAGLEAASVAVRNAERDLERFRTLFEKRAVTQHQFEQVEAGVAAARAREAQAKASLRMAETLLSYGRITAPSDGIITRKHMKEGNLAHPGAPLLTIEDPSALELLVSVPEERVSSLAPGQRASVSIDGLGKTLSATITNVVAAGDARTRTSTVKFAFEETEGLRPGQFASVRFDAFAEDVLSVDAGAVLHRGQMEGVFVVVEGTARLRWIRTGQQAGGRVQVLAGLEEGDAVVSPVPPELRDGTPVEVER